MTRPQIVKPNRIADTPWGVMSQFVSYLSQYLTQEDIRDLVDAPLFIARMCDAARGALKPTYYEVGDEYVQIGSTTHARVSNVRHAGKYSSHGRALCRYTLHVRTRQFDFIIPLDASDNRWQHIQGEAVWIKLADDGKGILVREQQL